MQVCHNYRDGGSGPSRTRVLHSFGRKDQLDLDALRRSVSSISKYYDPSEAAEVRTAAGVAIGARFRSAKHVGGTHLLHGVWKRLLPHERCGRRAHGAGVSRPRDSLAWGRLRRHLLTAIGAPTPDRHTPA
jgi:hypothetical protein